MLVDRSPFVIGSDPAAHLRLERPGIAPRHAQIVLLAGAHHIVPCGDGATPVNVDGAPVGEGGLLLVHGVRLRLGGDGAATLRFVDASVDAISDRGERLVALMEIARTITSSLAVDEVLDRVLEGAVRFSGAERGYLFLREGDRLAPWIPRGADPASVEVSLSVAEEVARSGKPVYRDHMAGAGRSASDSIVRLRLQAILCLPLAVRQDVIGVVYLDSRKRLPHHRPDLPLLEALAGLAAVAIQNSRLVEERVRTERTLIMGQMARAIVHDVRTPLSSIRGLADLLRGRASEDDPARPHLTTIIVEVDRLAGLTGDLLQFSSEAPPLRRDLVPLADLVRRTLETLAPRLTEKGIRVDLDLDDGARAALDAPRVLRVLHNLIANALDAMEGGGVLTLRAGLSGADCRLEVRDDGRGMSEDVQRRVFEPFFTHGKPQGTGLGMAIVRKIVEEHGGRIDIASAPGRGTRVLIEFPAGQDPARTGS